MSVSRPTIEREVRALQGRIWKRRHVLWPGQDLLLVDMLDPAVAAMILGVRFEYHDALGRFGYRGVQFETAGLLDRPKRLIAVSRALRTGTSRFTGAHEIAHWTLHPQEVMHRDRPTDGMVDDDVKRDPQEREADYFAACFLVPRKLLTKAVESTFGITGPFVINDASAYWLGRGDPDEIMNADTGSLTCARAIASATSYGGKHFNSLAEQFGVSVTTMAIRLREVGLIRE